MTALILGLLVAVGVGGGVAIANHNGSGGGDSSPSVTQSADMSAKREALNTKLAALAPDYDLVSALTDHDQYTITLGLEGTLYDQYHQPAVTPGALNKMSALNGTYDDSDDDLHKEPKLEGHSFYYNNQEIAPTLDLSPQNSGTINATAAQFYIEDNQLKLRETSFNFTAADKNQTNNHPYVKTNPVYDVFLHAEDDVAIGWNSCDMTLQKWTALYLGGAQVGAQSEHPGLTVADFGVWNDYIHPEMSNPSIEGLHDSNDEKFIFFDDQYAYDPALRATDHVNLTGNVLAQEAEGYANPKQIREIFTGNINLDLNLAENTVTGDVVMHDGVPEAYNISDMQGTISGSVVKFDGLAYQEGGPFPTQDNRFLGGMGKLLFGKYGIEMVGVLGNQIEIPTEEQREAFKTHAQERNNGVLPDDWERDLRKQGDSGYVFGAKEN